MIEEVSQGVLEVALTGVLGRALVNTIDECVCICVSVYVDKI